MLVICDTKIEVWILSLLCHIGWIGCANGQNGGCSTSSLGISDFLHCSHFVGTFLCSGLGVWLEMEE